MGWPHAAPDPGEPDLHDGLRADGVGAAARQPRRRRRAAGQPPAHRRGEGPRGRPRRPDAGRRHRRARGQGRQRLARRRTGWWISADGHDGGDPPGRPGARREVRPPRLRRARPAVGEPRPRRVGARRRDALLRVRRRTSRCPSCRAGRCTTRATRPTSSDGVRENARRTARTASAPPTHDDVDAIVEILDRPAAHVVRRQRRGRRARRRGRPAHPGAGDDPPGHPAAAPGRGARRSRQRQDGAGAAAGQGAAPAAGTDRQRQRVALLCYSIGLAEYLKRQVAHVGPQAPAGVRRHVPRVRPAVGRGRRRPRRTATSGRSGCRPRWRELAGGLPDGKKFDAVIVDEAQDFADSWWTPVLRALRDEEEGGLYVYSDENQRIFARFGRPPVRAGPARARPQPAQHQADPRVLRPARAEPDVRPRRRRSGGAVRAASATRPVDVADDEVDALLDDGWDPSNIALLTTGHRHPIQVERTDFHGQDGYWRTFWDDDVFYGHVLGCKGLERRAVVLCVNEDGVTDRARERLYVGMSRATDELVVVGDPETVRRVGGDDVAKRLGCLTPGCKPAPRRRRRRGRTAACLYTCASIRDACERDRQGTPRDRCTEARRSRAGRVWLGRRSRAGRERPRTARRPPIEPAYSLLVSAWFQSPPHTSRSATRRRRSRSSTASSVLSTCRVRRPTVRSEPHPFHGRIELTYGRTDPGRLRWLGAGPGADAIGRRLAIPAHRRRCAIRACEQ